MRHRLYVYGTLRRGEGDLFMIPGKMYDVGAFPGVVLTGEEKDFVVAECLEVSDEKLRQLDRYEGYREGDQTSHYLRLPCLDGWVYIYNRSVDHLPVIESGDWFDKTRQKMKEHL